MPRGSAITCPVRCLYAPVRGSLFITITVWNACWLNCARAWGLWKRAGFLHFCFHSHGLSCEPTQRCPVPVRQDFSFLSTCCDAYRIARAMCVVSNGKRDPLVLLILLCRISVIHLFLRRYGGLERQGNRVRRGFLWFGHGFIFISRTLLPADICVIYHSRKL